MKKDIRMHDIPLFEITIKDDERQGIRNISIVKEPAIEVMAMCFSKTELEENVKYEFKTFKDKQIMAGPAMIPYDVATGIGKKILRKDKHDGLKFVFFSKDTIKQMVDKFNMENNNKSIVVDHSSTKVMGFIQQNWIIEDSYYDKSRMYGYDLPVGTWFVEIKVLDEKFWKKEVIEMGKKGFSIEGLMDDSTMVDENYEIIDILKQYFSKQELKHIYSLFDDEDPDLVDDVDIEIPEEDLVNDDPDVHPNCKCVIEQGEWILSSGACDECIDAKNEYDNTGNYSKHKFGTDHTKDKFPLPKGKVLVSFDYDGTLDKPYVQEIARTRIKNGDDVYIVTKNAPKASITGLAERLGIPKKNVIFTNHNAKWSYLNKLGIMEHYDDMQDEIDEICSKTKVKTHKV